MARLPLLDAEGRGTTAPHGLAENLQIKPRDQFIVVEENNETFATAAITAQISDQPTRRP